MMESMATVHMTYNEVASNFAAVMEKIRKGVEVIVEQDHLPVALIRLPERSGRPISECIASAKASGSKVTLDGGFGHDVEEGIKDRDVPWNPPSWD
jgi:antitoxin (DNA-binding transcriptional repressor) of toxin-antitoxin stability system